MSTLAAQSVSRVKEWLASQIEQRRQIAKEAGIDEKTIRLSLAPDWDPRASTLHKLETVMPKKRARAA